MSFDDVKETVFFLKNSLNSYYTQLTGNQLNRAIWINTKFDMEMPDTCGLVNEGRGSKSINYFLELAKGAQNQKRVKTPFRVLF